MNKRTAELISLVEDWGKEKGILENSTPSKQLLKTLEETLELVTAITNDDREEQIDAIGDVLVTLILFSHMKELDFMELYINRTSLVKSGAKESDFAVLSNHPPELLLLDLVSGMYSVERAAEVWDIDVEFTRALGIDNLAIIDTATVVFLLERQASSIDSSLTFCLDVAYNVISKRTGKMVNGLFQKD